MSEHTVTVDYDGIYFRGEVVGNLEHCNCCGMREFSNFQDVAHSEGDSDAVWDWYDGLSDRQLKRLGLERDIMDWRIFEEKVKAKFLEAGITEQHGAHPLARLCHVLSTTGKEWKPPTAITILTLVENWDNAYPIMDALVEGGWQLSVDTVLNTNSRNDISLWTYRREEAV